MRQPRFGVKTYGIGIGPKGRAGWASVAIYLALMAAAPLAMRRLSWPLWSLPAACALLTLALLMLMVAEGDEKP